MSIRLLHEDAWALVEARHKQLLQAIADAELLIAMDAKEKILKNVKLSSDFENTHLVPLVRSRDIYASVLKSDVWTDCMTEPIDIIFPTREATSDLFDRIVAGRIFIYRRAFYAVEGIYNEEEAAVLLTDTISRRKRKAEYLIARKDIPQAEQEYERLAIPETVRHEVWRRDKGRCSKCHSVHNLEFDHVIPVSKGGANTARNIQILCESCNRVKSNNLG